MRPIVQHPKIAALRPVWAAFAGYSFICDQSGPRHDRYVFAQSAQTVAAFKALEDVVASYGTDRLMSEALLCALNPASYHITAMDLVHDQNVQKLERGPLSKEAVDDLVPTRKGEPRMPRILARLGVPNTAQPFDLRFRFDGFQRKAARALMCRMVPVDGAAADELERLKSWRRDLGGTALATLGLPLADLNPHLTLGYYANEKRAKRSSDKIKELERLTASALDGHTFAFDQVSLYGFATMERFFRIE